MTCPTCGGKNRSTPQHRRFFKLVSLAYEHWPETFSKFQPENSEHLRAWLLCKAGWRTEVSIEFADTQAQNGAGLTTIGIMKALGHYVWVQRRGDNLIVYAPRSVSYSKMQHKTACAIFDECEKIIANVLCIKDCDELLRQAERAA